jgi:hypothetical protein
VLYNISFSIFNLGRKTRKKVSGIYYIENTLSRKIQGICLQHKKTAKSRTENKYSIVQAHPSSRPSAGGMSQEAEMEVTPHHSTADRAATAKKSREEAACKLKAACKEAAKAAKTAAAGTGSGSGNISNRRRCHVLRRRPRFPRLTAASRY